MRVKRKTSLSNNGLIAVRWLGAAIGAAVGAAYQRCRQVASADGAKTGILKLSVISDTYFRHPARLVQDGRPPGHLYLMH